MNLNETNSLSRDEFVRILGPVFEHSPWIAEATWSRRSFASVEALRAALCETVRGAGKFDGPLGVIIAIACVQHLDEAKIRLPFAVEVAAFADEAVTVMPRANQPTMLRPNQWWQQQVSTGA